MGFFRNAFNNIKSTIGKARGGGNFVIGKVRTLARDVSRFTADIKDIVPIVSEIVNIASDFIPGGAVAKTGLKLGLKGLSAISKFSDLAAQSADQASKINNAPLPQAVRHFRDLFG